MSIAAQEPIWVPGREDVESAHLTHYMRWLAGRGLAPAGLTYEQLWRWSVEDLDRFWSSLWDYFDIIADGTATAVRTGAMPNVRWFPGTELSFAEHVLRNHRDGTAILDARETEDGDVEIARRVSWDELASQVARIAGVLTDLGVRSGHHVVGYLPNIPEAFVALLAATSIGAIWSVCGQDYSAASARSRFEQLAPVVLIAADGYRYGGKTHDRRDDVINLAGTLGSVRGVLTVPRLGLEPIEHEGFKDWHGVSRSAEPREPMRVPFAHPVWVLFSSGTTGRPKGIVHSTGGALLEHLKAMRLNLDLGPADTFFWYTTTSWMVWNYQVSSLLAGATAVTFDGSPAGNGYKALWRLVELAGVTVFGTSPAQLGATRANGIVPRSDFDLSQLRALGSSGSTLVAELGTWATHDVGPGIRIDSTTGGTDIVSAFAGGNPLVPVWAGEISRPCLGVALDAWGDDGKPVRGDVGELVVTQPMPSMPLEFANDPDGAMYRGAYFEKFPQVWTHGDWITITDHGSIVVHGRSDATLNRKGVRMGSAEIYGVVDNFAEVADSLVVGVETGDGGYWMPLFIQLAEHVTQSEELGQRIREAIRRDVSPKHVPDEVYVVPAIPHTRTGKRLEVPVKRLLQGGQLEKVIDPGAVDDVEAVKWFADFAQKVQSS